MSTKPLVATICRKFHFNAAHRLPEIDTNKKLAITLYETERNDVEYQGE